MARRSQDELLYEAFQAFKERCLLSDRSLLWPDNIAWTSTNVGQVKEWLFDAPVAGAKQSFDEKLVQQMVGADPVHWMILADIFFIYFLPSTHYTVSTNSRRWSGQRARVG